MFSTTTALGDIAHVIQLAIAPVFLLNAVGALLVVLTNRLGRSVDRRRILAATVHQLQEPFLSDAIEEIGLIAQRVNLIYTAIVLAVICALFVCLLIAVAFVDAIVETDLAWMVATMFVIAMLALVCSLGAFLREIFLAVTSASGTIR